MSQDNKKLCQFVVLKFVISCIQTFTWTYLGYLLAKIVNLEKTIIQQKAVKKNYNSYLGNHEKADFE